MYSVSGGRSWRYPMPLTRPRAHFVLCAIPAVRSSELSWWLSTGSSCFIPSPALHSLQCWIWSGRGGISPKCLPAADFFSWRVLFHCTFPAGRRPRCIREMSTNLYPRCQHCIGMGWNPYLRQGLRAQIEVKCHSWHASLQQNNLFICVRLSYCTCAFQFAAVGLNVLLSRASSPLTITLHTDYRGLSATTEQFFIPSTECTPLTFNFKKWGNYTTHLPPPTRKKKEKKFPWEDKNTDMQQISQ